MSIPGVSSPSPTNPNLPRSPVPVSAEEQIPTVDLAPSLVDRHTLVHHFCDGYSSGSDYGGRLFHSSIQQVLGLLKHIRDHANIPLPRELIERYELLLELTRAVNDRCTSYPTEETYKFMADLAKKMGEHVLSLGENEIVTLPLGYNKTGGGHAMLLDVRANADGTYDLMVYTTGDGLDYHESIQTEDKKVALVRLCFSNVPYETLFFSKDRESPTFLLFESIIYPRMIKQDRAFGASFIFEYLFRELYDHYDRTKSVREDYRKPQGDGNCYWKVIMKHFSYQVPREVYRRSRLIMDRDMIIAFHKKGEAESNREAQNILLIATEKVHGRIQRCLKESVITTEEAEETQKIATDIQNQVRTYNPPSNALIDVEDPVQVTPHTFTSGSNLLGIDWAPCPLFNPRTIPSYPPIEVECSSESFGQALEQIYRYANQIDFSERLYAIEYFFEQIPLVDHTFWEQIPEPQHSECLDRISCIMRIYHKETLLENGYISGRQVNTLLALYIATDRLARMIEKKQKKILDDFSPYNPIPTLDNEPFFQLGNDTEVSRFQEARDYFSQNNRHYQIPALNTLAVISESNIHKNAISRFYHQVATQYQSVANSCEKAYGANLRKMVYEYQVPKDLINTYLLIKDNFHLSGTDGKTRHLHSWFSAIWTMQTLLPSGPSIRDQQAPPSRPDKCYIDSTWRGFAFYYDKWKPQERFQGFYQKPDERLSTFFHDNFHLRKLSHDILEPRENEALTTSQDRVAPLMPDWAAREIYWSSAERKLQLFHLLFYFHNHLDQLEEPSYRTTLYLQFFKTLVVDQANGNIENLVIDDGALLDVICDFVEAGISHFHESQIEKTPFSPASLFPIFFMQKARQCCRVPPEDIRAGRFYRLSNQLHARLNLWLESVDISQSDRALVHLHRIHHFQSLQEGNFSDHDLGEILGSWCYYNNHLIKTDDQLPFLEAATSNFVKHLVCSIGRQSEIDYTVVAAEILKALTVEHGHTEPLSWEKNDNYLLSDQQGLDLTIDLLAGSVFCKGKATSLSPPRDLFTLKDYTRLFGDGQYDFYTVATSMDYIYFDHPQHGTFRVVKGGGSSWDIQHEFDGRWYRLIRRENVCFVAKYAFPMSLIIGHHHFIPTNSEPDHLLITNEELKIVARMNSEGVIQGGNGELLSRQSITAQEGSLFDKGAYQLVRFNAAGQPKEWEISRYYSINEHPLAFVHRDGVWAWKENPHFIVTGQKKPFLGGNLPNYYHLIQTHTGQEKVLIPDRPVELCSARTFDPKAVLEIGAENEPDRDKLDQMEYFTYFTYNVGEEDALIAENLEGALFLAYLYLHQGRYDDFLEQLQLLSPVDTPSAQAFELLERILKYPKTYPKRFPHAHALILKTATLFMAHHDKLDLDWDQKKMQKRLREPYECYLQYLNRVNEKYRLTVEEELTILRVVPNSTRESYLKGRRLPLGHNLGQTPSHIPLDGNTEELRGIDIDYEGGTPPTDSFAHLGKFSTNKDFFRKAWDVIASKDDCAQRRLQHQLRMMKGIRTLTPDSSCGSAVQTNTVDFYLLWDSCDRHPYPSEFKGEVGGKLKPAWKVVEEWTESLFHNKVASTKANSFPTKPSPCFPGTALSTRGCASPYFDRLKLSALPRQSPFVGIIALFNGVPLVQGEFKDLSDVWNFTIPDHLARYQGAIEEEIQHTKKMLKQGREFLATMKQYHLPEEQVPACLELFEAIINSEKMKVLELEGEIVRKANAVPDAGQLQLHLRVGANQVSRIDMVRLSRLFLQRSKAGFRRVNPHLTDPDIENLFDLLGEWNYRMVLYNVAVSAKKDLLEIEKIDAMEAAPDQHMRRDHLCQQVVTELQKHPHYPADMDVEALTSARISHKIPRADQISDVQLFTDKKNKNCVLQKIMGGGKTSVDAALWAHLCAQREKLPVLIVHNSQKSQVQDNLKKSQKTVFGQDVFTIDYTREELTLPRLSYILDRLENAIKSKELLIICPEMIYTLDLQGELLLLRLLGLDGSDCAVNDKDAFAKTGVLNEIDVFFQEKAEALGDEVDLLFNNYQETNIPIGGIKQVPVGRVALAQEIFTLLIDKEEQIDGLPLREYIGIPSNRQTALPTPEYRKKVLPVVARKLAKQHFSSLRGKEHLHESFVRFVLRELDPIIDQVRLGLADKGNLSPTQAVDLEFMRHLHELYAHPNAAIKEEANLICVAKHILADLVPAAFKLSPGRNFGRWKDQGQQVKTPFKVVPFLGVDTPALTEFGQHYEAIVKQFLTALQFDVEGEQIQLVGDKMLQAAKMALRNEEGHLEDTAEFKGFKEITGIDLSQAHNPSRAKEAASHVGTDPVLKLALEGETAALYATFYEARLTRRPQVLSKKFSKLSMMGGTPWNCDGYNPSFLDNLHLDMGAEGAILQMILNRADETPVHILREMTPEAIFETIYKAYPDNFLQGIFDSGGIFSHFKSQDFARTFMAFARKKKLSFKGCLFFDSRVGQGNSDQFSATINGFTTPVPVHGTHSQDIEEATNFSAENFFVYLSEKQTTGTDLPFSPSAKAVWTVDEGILLRTVLQTTLRLRQFFYHQRAGAMIPAYMIPNLARKEGTLADIIATSIINQGVKKSDSLDRSYHNMIDQVFQDFAREARRDAYQYRDGKKDLLDRLRPYYEILHPYLVLKTVDEPFLHFAPLEEAVDYTSYLERYANRAISLFEQRMHNARVKYDNDLFSRRIIAEIEIDFQERIRPEILALVERARTIHSKKLPKTKTVPSLVVAGDAPETPLRLESEIHQELQVEREIQLETELQRELSHYENLSTGFPRSEWLWNREEAFAFIRDLSETANSIKLSRLNESFQKVIEYRHDFAFWDENIFGTHNFFLSQEKALPVFHTTQRPARQILSITIPEKEPLFVLLSARECIFFKEFLEENYLKHPELLQHVYLLHPSKKPFVANPYEADPTSPDFDRGIAQINLYGGTASLIDPMYFGLAEKWMSEACQNEEVCTCPQRKQIFMKLRVERNEAERNFFYQSSLLCDSDAHRHTSLARMRDEICQFDPRLIPTVRDVSKIFRFKIREIEHITPEQVPYIHPNMIRYLAKENLIQAVSVEKVRHLTETQIPYIHVSQIRGVTRKGLLQKLSNSRVLNDLTYEVAKDFVGDLSSEQLILLRDPRFVSHIADANLGFLHGSLVPNIDVEKYGYLSPRQIPFVPVEHYDALSPDQFDHLSDEQVAKLDDAIYIGNLRKKEKLLLLSSEQLDALPLSALAEAIDRCDEIISRLPLIPTVALARAETSASGWICSLRDHLSSFDDPAIIRLLPEDWMLNYINPSLANMIPQERLSELSDCALISNLEPGSIEYLSQEALEKITLSQLAQNLHNPVVVDALRPAVLDHIMLASHMSPLKDLIALAKAEHKLISDSAKKALEACTDPEIVPLADTPELLNKLHRLADDIPTERYSELTEEMIPNLPDEELWHLSTEQMEYLSRWQVRSLLAPATIARLPTNVLQHLANYQMEHLSREQVEQIEDHEILLCLPKSKIEFVDSKLIDSLSPEVVKRIWKSNLIRRLQPDAIQFLPPECLGKITVSQLARNLHTPAIVEALCPAVLDRIMFASRMSPPKDLIALAKSESILISDYAKKALEACTDPEIVPLADTPELLNKLYRLTDHIPTERYPELTEEMIPRLPPQYLGLLSVEQMEHLSLEQVTWIEDPEAIAKIWKHTQIQRLQPDAIQFLPRKRLGRISPSQLARNLHKPAIVDKLTQRMVEDIVSRWLSFPLEDLIALAKSEHKWISDSAKKALEECANSEIVPLADTPELLNKLHRLAVHIPPERYPELTGEMIPHLPDKGLWRLSTKQMEHLSRWQVEGILAPATIARLPTNSLQHLSTMQMECLVEEQVEKIEDHETLLKLPKSKIEFVDSKLIETLPPKVIARISRTNLIRRLPPDALEFLPPERLRKITASQLARSLQNPTVVDKLSDSHIETIMNDGYWCTPEELIALEKSEHKLISSHAKNKLTAAIDHISTERYPELTGEMIPRCTLLSPPQVPLVSSERFHLLVGEQLRHTTPIQCVAAHCLDIHGMGDGVQPQLTGTNWGGRQVRQLSARESTLSTEALACIDGVLRSFEHLPHSTNDG